MTSLRHRQTQNEVFPLAPKIINEGHLYWKDRLLNIILLRQINLSRVLNHRQTQTNTHTYAHIRTHTNRKAYKNSNTHQIIITKSYTHTHSHTQS